MRRLASVLLLMGLVSPAAASTTSPVAEAQATPAPKSVDPVARRTMQVHFLIASEHYKEGNYQAAIEAWKEVLRIEPGHALAKEKIERAKAKLGR